MRLRRKRRFFTAAESAEIWERWRRGEGLKSIGRVFGKTSSSIFAHIRPSGGIRPSQRRRSRLALTLAEREEISRGLVHGHSLRRIARILGRAPSTVVREIGRNGGSGPYPAAASDRRAWDRARRPKRCKLAVHEQLRQAVAAKLERNWSPEQIAGWLKRTHPEDCQVSHETIYRSLYVQARGVLKKELLLHLECRHVKAGLSAMRNKTDRNDARGIAHLVRLGWFRLVHVKSEAAQEIRMLLVNRNLLLGKLQDIENSVRGSLKVFGLRLGKVTKALLRDSSS